MAIKDKEISQVRKRIEKTIQLAEEERKRKLQIQRLEFAHAGITAFKKRRFGETVRSFQSYLKTLEDLKGVSEGGLHPSCFDIKKDQQELLMISGIYWDLVKLFDRTRSAQNRKEFHHYFQKYLLFSKGMPFQPLCAESIRKYISSDKPVHKSEFTNAYRVLSISRCFIVTSLMDVTSLDTLPTLRKLRDHHLKKHTLGRAFIYQYYRYGPVLAEKIDHLPPFVRKGLGLHLDLLASIYHLMEQCSNSLRPKDKLAVRQARPKR